MRIKVGWQIVWILGAIAVLVLSPAARAEETAGGGNSEAHTRRHHDKADRNFDGVVDETEKAKADEIRAKWQERKEKADTNDDGKVDKAERQNAKEHLKKHWENPPGPKGGPGASPNRKHRKV